MAVPVIFYMYKAGLFVASKVEAVGTPKGVTK